MDEEEKIYRKGKIREGKKEISRGVQMVGSILNQTEPNKSKT